MSLALNGECFVNVNGFINALSVQASVPVLVLMRLRLDECGDKFKLNTSDYDIRYFNSDDFEIFVSDGCRLCNGTRKMYDMLLMKNLVCSLKTGKLKINLWGGNHYILADVKDLSITSITINQNTPLYLE